MECSACKKLLPDNDFVKCVKGCQLHYDCAGIAKKTYSQMRQPKRDSYKCILCRGYDLPFNDLSQKEPIEQFLLRREEEFMQRMEDRIENMIANSLAKNTELLQNKIDEIDEVVKSVKFISEQYDEMVAQNQELKKELSSMEEKTEIIQARNESLNCEVESLKLQLEEMQQYGRNHNIQIDGIPEVNNENVYNLINRLAIALDEPIILNQHIQAAHRIPAKRSNKPKPLVVQFTNRQKRDTILRKAKAKRVKTTDFLENVPVSAVFVNEHLTPYYKTLLYEAKKLKVEKDYKYVWISNSKILVRKNDESVIRITSESGIQKLFE